MKRPPTDPLAEKNFRTSCTRLLVLVAAPVAIGLNGTSLSFAAPSETDKRMTRAADRGDHGKTKKKAVYVGNVPRTQRTWSIQAGKMIVNQNPATFQNGIASGKPARFRRK